MTSARLVLVPAALWLGTACTIVTTQAGPTYWGDTREQARLQAISERPSEGGTKEATLEWARHPEWDVARSAVFAAIPAYAGPMEAKFDELSGEQQREVIAYAGSVRGDAASALVLRLSAAGGMVDEGIAALAGKQDQAAVQGLLDLANSGAEGTRVAAVKALEPPDTALARDGLLALTQPTRPIASVPATATGGQAEPIPEAVRLAAVDVLAPYADPVVRTQLLARVAAEDSAVTARILDDFDAPRDDTEITAILAATEAARHGAAAVRLLDRQPTPPERVLARFLALADPAATVDPSKHGARYEAGAALVRRNDLRGAPALVLLLDDGAYRAPCIEVLDGLVIANLPALREQSPRLTTTDGKAEAARLIARFGGPVDEALITSLASPNEGAKLKSGLATAPFGLFPTGHVSYAPALNAIDSPSDHTLEEVIAEGRKARDTRADPVVSYIGAARAWLAGARSTSDTKALAAAAEAAKASFGVNFDNQLDTAGTGLAETIGSPLADATRKRSGVPALTTAITSTVPRAKLSGKLACKLDDHKETESLAGMTHYYTVLVDNPNKAYLKSQVDNYPWDKRTITECSQVCYCYVAGSGMNTHNMSCDAGYTPSGDCNCNQTTTTSENPAYTQLVADYNNEPEYTEQQMSVPTTRTKMITVHGERCDGPVTVAIGAASHTGQLHYQGEKRDWYVHAEAHPYHPDGTRLEVWTNDGEPGSSDTRPANLDAAVSSALSGYAPTVAQVRTMYADAVKTAVAKGDARAARDVLVWSNPALIGTDAASLEAFRGVFLTDAPTSFPAAWKSP